MQAKLKTMRSAPTEPLITLITVVFNAAQTFEQTIQSVIGQSYRNVQYIVVDGGSTDGSLEIIKQYADYIDCWLSEKDGGIYDAMNKGISLATGEIIGVLNADDLYAHNHVLEDVLAVFKDSTIDACFSDLVYVDRKDTDRVVRYWQSKPYQDGLFQIGWMPPHPTFFVRRKVYDQFGLFDLNFKIAADVELLMRFIAKHKIKTVYLPRITVKMRVGGTTNKSWLNIIRQNVEIYKAARKNGFSLSPFFIPRKSIDRLSQFIKRPARLP